MSIAIPEVEKRVQGESGEQHFVLDGVDWEQYVTINDAFPDRANLRIIYLTIQPPPDLAIEVEVTHPADKAIAVHSRIGVPEVWRFDVRKGTLAFLLLGDDGIYQPAARSRSLPKLRPDDVLVQMRLAEEAGSFTRWYAQLNEWVRATILPRLPEG